MSQPPPHPSQQAHSGAGGGVPPPAAGGFSGAMPMMPMMPMMMPGMPPQMMAGMTPQMMQQQMALMQQQMQAMMSGQMQFPMAGMMPPGGMFGMPGMPPMQMPQMPQMPGMAPQAAAVVAPSASPPVAAAAAQHPAPAPSPQAAAAPPRAVQPAAVQHTVAPLPAMPMMPVAPMAMPMMPFGMTGMMPPQQPQQPKVDPQWVVSKAAPVVAAAPTPAAAPPKPDVFGDLSNPDLALRKERFVIEQTKVKTAPPASAGVRAEDEEEEEFADFTSGEQHKADDFSFGPSPPAAVVSPPQQPQQSSPSNELSFDPEPSTSAPSVAAVPLPKQDLSADALMSKAFGMFEHKTNAPLVAQASMSQIASHTPQKASHAAASATHKGKRDMPQDLDDLLNNLVGGDVSAPTVELPSLGAEKPKPAAAAAAVEDDDEDFADFATASSAAAPPAAAAAAASVEDDDEDFADFSSSSPISAPTTAAAPAPKGSPVAVEEDDDEGFSDFGSAQPAAVPQTTTFSSFSPPTSSFGAGIPTSSFGDMSLPQSSFAAPQSSFTAPQSSFTSPQLSSYTSPPPAFAAAPAFVPKEAYQPPQQTEVEDEEENEEFADFSSAPSTNVSTQPLESDPFGSLGGESTADTALASLSPDVVVPPPAASPAAASVEDAESEEDFADFSSAPASSDPSAFDVHAVDPAVAAAAAAEAEAAAAAEAASHEPKKEEDLIGDWGTTKTTKKSNPFAVATPEADAPAITVTAPAPIVPSPAPSFDDVFGSLVDTEEVAAPVLPDLLPGAPLSTSSAARVGRGSITTAQAVASSHRPGGAFLAAPSSARPAGSDAEEDGDDDGFGGFASSASDGAKVHAFVPSSSFDSLSLEKSPPSVQASPAPVAFEFSEEAQSMSLPSELHVHSRIPHDFTLPPRAVEESVPTNLEEAMAMLRRQERFSELLAAEATRTSSSQLAELQAQYKGALAAAEEDESDDGAQLAAAMALQKQIKKLKALKPDEKWMRPLTVEEESSSPATYDQIKSALTLIDPAWQVAFSTAYPVPWAVVAEGGKVDEALKMQAEANDLLRSVLGPAASEIDAHAQRMKKSLAYIQEQLQKGQLFVKESSQLDLTDPSKQAEFVALLSAPSSPTVSFLTGLATLYRIVLKLEFSNAVFEQLQMPKEDFDAAHQTWLSIVQHLHSAPLKTFVGEWLATNSVDVDAVRQKLNEDNSAEKLVARRGRHSCPYTLVNQEAASSKDPACTALHSHLRL